MGFDSIGMASTITGTLFGDWEWIGLSTPMERPVAWMSSIVALVAIFYIGYVFGRRSGPNDGLPPAS